MLLRAKAGYAKQALLQSAGLRLADLDPFGKRILDLYARVEVRIKQYDAWANEFGFLDEKGNTPPFVKEYYSAIRTAARLLSQLERHLERLNAAGPSPLERHLASHYIDAEAEEVD